VIMQALAALVSLALLAGGQSATKANFSGEWKMNVMKSDFGALPPPEFITRTITHDDPSLTIVELQRSAMGDQNATRTYRTDGTDTTFESNGVTVAGNAKWTESTLVVTSKVDAIGLNFVDTMSLSADGKTLTSKVRIGSPQGDLDVTIVFDKQ
jgi:hypothetical protein